MSGKYHLRILYPDADRACSVDCVSDTPFSTINVGDIIRTHDLHESFIDGEECVVKAIGVEHTINDDKGLLTMHMVRVFTEYVPVKDD